MNSKNNGLQVVALIVSIASIPLACLSYAYIGVFVGLVGMLLAIQARKAGPAPLIKAAMICAVIGMVAGLSSIVLTIAFYILATS